MNKQIGTTGEAAFTGVPIEAKYVQWDGGLQSDAIAVLGGPGGCIVSPTKVGYVVMTTDGPGLQRKFSAKQRGEHKPAVVLCGSIDQLLELADVTPEIEAFYRDCVNRDILMGCILPWKEDAISLIPDDQAVNLAMDSRGTSCFVVQFGTPSVQIAQHLWEMDRKLVFASSANPSGKGNRGVVAGIGDRIESEVDLIVTADHYVSSVQPDASLETRYEQGVMVSFVDTIGRHRLDADQNPIPTLIRKGLDCDEIMTVLSSHFDAWDYRHGDYY